MFEQALFACRKTSCVLEERTHRLKCNLRNYQLLSDDN